MFFNSGYFLFVLIPGMVLMGLAQLWLRSRYSRYSQVANSRSITGAEAAAVIMRSAGINDVRIEGVVGQLTDHFDPRDKVLRLSEQIYGGRSIAAIAVAAHEAGHAVQQNVSYAPMAFRSGLVPIANLGSQLAPLVIIGGLVLQMSGLVWLGVILFAGATLFALVTLPVEFDASARARTLLAQTGLITQQEYPEIQKMLNAAAMTYVAGFAASALQLLYYVMLALGMGGRRRD